MKYLVIRVLKIEQSLVVDAASVEEACATAADEESNPGWRDVNSGDYTNYDYNATELKEGSNE